MWSTTLPLIYASYFSFCVDEKDDCTIVSLSPMDSNSQTPITATGVFTETCTPNSSVSNSPKSPSELRTNVRVCSSISPCPSHMLSGEKDEKTKTILQGHDLRSLGVNGSLQLSALQKQSRIKCESNKCSDSGHISSCCWYGQSDLRSPSLLHAPKSSLQLEDGVASRSECTENDCETPLSDISPLQRKRKSTGEVIKHSLVTAPHRDGKSKKIRKQNTVCR